MAKNTSTNISICMNSDLNATTIQAMLEAKEIAENPKVKGYHDLDKLFKDLNSK